MDINKYGYAQVIAALVECNENLKKALGGAQFAKDEALFHKLFEKQSELMALAGDLIKEKTNG